MTSQPVFKDGPSLPIPASWFDECLRCGQPVEGKCRVTMGGVIHDRCPTGADA